MSKPKLERLIKEIAMFDMDAACKLHKRKDKQNYNDSYDLDKAMIWDAGKEGNGYWNDINDKLKARRKNYHPHRDLMIEYANDKSVVTQNYYEQQWCDMSEPAFFISQQYRKKPKLVKKVIEYRIYLDKKNKIHMIENKDTETPHFLKWLGDWQKVEIEVEEND